MIKNLMALFIIILLLFMVFTMDTFFNYEKCISTFEDYSNSKLKISNNILTDYYSKDPSLKEEASKSIIRTTLKNLSYNKWIEYIDYIQLNVYQSNILPGNNKELIVALNLSKDVAVIGIYKWMNDDYIFIDKIENILPIKNIEFIPLKDLGYNLMITDQLLDERLGSFFIEEFNEIFLYIDHGFKSVWKKTKFMEEIYNAQWINPKASANQWIKMIENNKIEFKKEPSLNIILSIHRQKQEAIKDTFPGDKDFKVIKNQYIKEYYHWSPKYKTFIMKEGVINHSSKTVGIIGDIKDWPEYFLGLKSNNYKTVTSEGNILYLNKKSISIISQ